MTSDYLLAWIKRVEEVTIKVSMVSKEDAMLLRDIVHNLKLSAKKEEEEDNKDLLVFCNFISE